MASMSIRDGAVQGLVVTAIVLIFGLVISKMQDLLKISEVVVAGAFVLSTIIISSCVVAYFSGELSKKWDSDAGSIRNHVASLESAIEAMATAAKVDWLVTNQQLMRIESEIKGGEIWIITGSLEEEISEELYEPVIQENIKKGVVYRYLIPDDPLLRNRAATLKERVKASPQVSFHFISHTLFKIVAQQDVAIYVPERGSNRRPRGYMNLPLPQGGTDYFIAMGDDHSERMVANLKQFLSAKA